MSHTKPDSKSLRFYQLDEQSPHLKSRYHTSKVDNTLRKAFNVCSLSDDLCLRKTCMNRLRELFVKFSPCSWSENKYSFIINMQSKNAKHNCLNSSWKRNHFEQWISKGYIVTT